MGREPIIDANRMMHYPAPDLMKTYTNWFAIGTPRRATEAVPVERIWTRRRNVVIYQQAASGEIRKEAEVATTPSFEVVAAPTGTLITDTTKPMRAGLTGTAGAAPSHA